MIYKISYERDGGKFERLKLSNQDKVVISIPLTYFNILFQGKCEFGLKYS